MKKVLIGFDIDGTLRNNRYKDKVVPNEDVRTLLVLLAKMKNTKILVWSGGGELYARQVVASMGIDKYVDAYAGKQRVACQNPLSECSEPDQHHHHFVLPEGLKRPDICIDDIHTFELGLINLIVNEK